MLGLLQENFFTRLRAVRLVISDGPVFGEHANSAHHAPFTREHAHFPSGVFCPEKFARATLHAAGDVTVRRPAA